jgi:hypothetical protein
LENQLKDDRWVIRDDGSGQEDKMAWSAVTSFMQLEINAAAGPSVPSTSISPPAASLPSTSAPVSSDIVDVSDADWLSEPCPFDSDAESPAEDELGDYEGHDPGWRLPSNFQSKKHPFTERRVGAAMSRDSFGEGGPTPVKLFLHMFAIEVWKLGVLYTNLYATHYEIANWVTLTLPELLEWLSIVLFMGVVQMADYRRHWSSDPMFKKEFPANTMTENRWQAIKNNLHFHDTLQEKREKAKRRSTVAMKVKAFLEPLRKKCMTSWIPSENIAVDEMGIKFKGRHGAKQ